MTSEGTGQPEESQDPEEPQDIGAILRIHRQQRKLTGAALAEHVGLSQAKISRIETGRTIANADDVHAIAQSLDIPADETARLVNIARQRSSISHGTKRRLDRAR